MNLGAASVCLSVPVPSKLGCALHPHLPGKGASDYQERRVGGTEMKSQPCLGLSGFPLSWLRLGFRETLNVGGKPQKPPPPPRREGKQLRFTSGTGYLKVTLYCVCMARFWQQKSCMGSLCEV